MTNVEYLNNLLISYKHTEVQVEEEMEQEALLEEKEVVRFLGCFDMIEK